MDGQIKLRFFNHIIWIDPNKAIRTEASQLIWMYGPAVEVFQRADDALEFIKERNKTNILVLCASREVDNCYAAFNKLTNIYQKFIVFCGSRSRATQLKSFSPYREAIQDAYWEIGDLINGISELQEQMLSQPQLMKTKVNVVENKLPPIIPQAQGPKFLQNLKKANEEKQNQKKKEEKKEEQEQKKQEQNLKQKQSEQQSQKGEVESKVKENARIIWEFQADDNNEKKLKEKMRKKGYPVHQPQPGNELKYLVSEEPTFDYFLIAKVGTNIEELKSNINSLPLTIRLGKQNERDGLAEDETFATNIEEIIKLLQQHDISQA